MKTYPVIKGRWVSILLALGAIIWVWSTVALNQSFSHGGLALTLIGVSLCFVHGVGWQPKSIWEWLCFNPILAWLILLIGFTYL